MHTVCRQKSVENADSLDTVEVTDCKCTIVICELEDYRVCSIVVHHSGTCVVVPVWWYLCASVWWYLCSGSCVEELWHSKSSQDSWPLCPPKGLQTDQSVPAQKVILFLKVRNHCYPFRI